MSQYSILEFKAYKEITEEGYQQSCEILSKTDLIQKLRQR